MIKKLLRKIFYEVKMCLFRVTSLLVCSSNTPVLRLIGSAWLRLQSNWRPVEPGQETAQNNTSLPSVTPIAPLMDFSMALSPTGPLMDFSIGLSPCFELSNYSEMSDRS